MAIEVGRIYVSKSGGAGYFMVMGVGKGLVTCSPLFWRDKVVEFNYPIGIFDDLFELFDESRMAQMSTKIQASYDREKLVRWRLIDEDVKTRHVHGHGRDSGEKGNVLSWKHRRSHR